MTNSTLPQDTPDLDANATTFEVNTEGLSTDELNGDVTRYVVVNVNENLYGMATDTTVELMSATMSQITRVPHSPEFISGVINHRGTIIPVIDARSLLGFSRRGQEASKLHALFDQLKADHVEWLEALESAVLDNTPFEKPIDPNRCQFGRWFSSVLDETVAECRDELLDPTVNAIVKRFATPHQRIHSIAQRVLELRDQGHNDQAIGIIESARTTDLASMCELFDQVKASIDSLYDSMLVITESDGQKAAIAVDGVSFVADCKDRDVEPLPDTADNTEFLSGLVHRPDGSYILIADLANIYAHACVSQ